MLFNKLLKDLSESKTLTKKEKLVLENMLIYKSEDKILAFIEETKPEYLEEAGLTGALLGAAGVAYVGRLIYMIYKDKKLTDQAIKDCKESPNGDKCVAWKKIANK